MGGNACGPFSVREKTMHRDSFFQTLFLPWGPVRVNFNRQHGLETATLQNRNVNKRHKDGWNCNRKREKQKYSGKIPKATWLPRKILAKRVSRRPINAHFWKKYKESSLNLLKFYEKACLLDGQFSLSGLKPASIRLTNWVLSNLKFLVALICMK